MWGVSYFTYHKKMNSWFCTNWSEGYPLSEGTFSQEIWNPVARQRLLSIYNITISSSIHIPPEIMRLIYSLSLENRERCSGGNYAWQNRKNKCVWIWQNTFQFILKTGKGKLKQLHTCTIKFIEKFWARQVFNENSSRTSTWILSEYQLRPTEKRRNPSWEFNLIYSDEDRKCSTYKILIRLDWKTERNGWETAEWRTS